MCVRLRATIPIATAHASWVREREVKSDDVLVNLHFDEEDEKGGARSLSR